MNTWYLAKVSFTHENEDGVFKRVIASFLVSGINFTDVETKIIKQMSEIVKGEYKIKGITPTKYSDIFDFTEENDSFEEEYFFDCKISYLSVTEDKSKKTVIPVLVSAKDVKQAEERLGQSIKNLIPDFDVNSIKKTDIVEIVK